MSSRQEEKERRRKEREEREAAEHASASRRKRLQYVFGGFLAVVVVAGVAALAFGALGSSGTSSGKGSPETPKGGADIPGVQETDLKKAAAAAGCTLSNPQIEGNTHEDKDFKASDYKTNPPTSGNHNPVWYQDGEYAPGNTPKLGQLVHPLEHGRIEIQYQKGSPSQTVKQLETLFKELDDGYHMLLFENTTDMKYAVAATAWGHSLTCPTMNDKVFDAIRTFRTAFINKGPETVP
jgi:Protein of unknown function (DUF3105)